MKSWAPMTTHRHIDPKHRKRNSARLRAKAFRLSWNASFFAASCLSGEVVWASLNSRTKLQSELPQVTQLFLPSRQPK